MFCEILWHSQEIINGGYSTSQFRGSFGTIHEKDGLFQLLLKKFPEIRLWRGIPGFEIFMNSF